MWRGTEVSCQQPCQLDTFKVDFLAPVKPSADCSPHQGLKCKFMGDTELEHPAMPSMSPDPQKLGEINKCLLFYTATFGDNLFHSSK